MDIGGVDNVNTLRAQYGHWWGGQCQYSEGTIWTLVGWTMSIL